MNGQDAMVGRGVLDPPSATGVVHVVGGEVRPNSGCVRVSKHGVGELVVRGEGVVKTGTALSLGHESETAKGRVMLCKGGVIEAAQVIGHGTTDDERYADFVFDGGTLALAAGASLPASTAITVADGATLDLGGNAAAAASLSGAGTLANGTLSLTGSADISSMSFALGDGVLPSSNEPVVVLEAAGGVTGQFASATLPHGRKLSYSGNQVRLAKKGMLVIVR